MYLPLSSIFVSLQMRNFNHSWQVSLSHHLPTSVSHSQPQPDRVSHFWQGFQNRLTVISGFSLYLSPLESENNQSNWGSARHAPPPHPQDHVTSALTYHRQWREGGKTLKWFFEWPWAGQNGSKCENATQEQATAQAPQPRTAPNSTTHLPTHQSTVSSSGASFRTLQWSSVYAWCCQKCENSEKNNTWITDKHSDRAQTWGAHSQGPTLEAQSKSRAF